MQKVAWNEKNFSKYWKVPKVAEQLVESPREKGGGGGGVVWVATQ